MIDLLELNDDIYLEFGLDAKYYICMYYCPANHRLFCYLQDNKEASTTAESYIEFKKFL